MSKFIKDIYEGYQYKGMKAKQVYPVKKDDAITVGFLIDTETIDELITQLMLAKRQGAKEISVKGFKTDKSLFITIEK
ncbi:hypothetical protein [Sutcliffiella horikoshii]|uniref:hypothetical protein n=1 Tax=Sutcliffiella horikoshii TaxID=79883 RepID=UPI00384F05EB